MCCHILSHSNSHSIMLVQKASVCSGKRGDRMSDTVCYIDCRAAQLQALQPPTNYYQQTPLQQTGFYQAQQTGSTLQVASDCYSCS